MKELRVSAMLALLLAVAGSPARAAGAPAAPEDGGPRNFVVVGAAATVDLRFEPAAEAGLAGSVARGSILDNLGCRSVDERVWCDVQAPGSGPRGFVPLEALEPAVSPDGSVAAGPDDSAERAGRGEFDAWGNVPCAQAPGQPMGQCEFAASRAGGGYATVVVEWPDGSSRAIYFRMGRPTGSDASGEAGFDARQEGDLHLVRIGDERYEIPDAVVHGG
ncbi:MAG TPA: hypothetical protein VLA66_11180 [Thermoanaerobaculia bacterium]|nr:hypothetical protein [Thermoanaerobaculia bacterium]